jgi:hypothetical protein
VLKSSQHAHTGILKQRLTVLLLWPPWPVLLSRSEHLWFAASPMQALGQCKPRQSAQHWAASRV